jgi:molybdopterin converting factor small subunit
MEAAAIPEQLEAALAKKRDYLEEKGLPRLKERFSTFQALFESFYQLLLRKSLIHEDPYKDEQKISEVTLPPADGFPDTERSEKLSQRLASFHSQLDFLNTTYQFTLSFLSRSRLKRILVLAAYIEWTHLSESSTSPTTAALASLISRIRLGSDSMSTSLLKNAVGQLEITVGQILALLKEVLSFQREQYKLELRRKVFSQLSELPDLGPDNLEPARKSVRKLFPQAMPGERFEEELAEEVIAEDFLNPGGERQAAVLKSLAVPEARSRQPTRIPSFRQILLEAVRALVKTHYPLADAWKKVSENHLVLESRRMSLGELLRRWLRRIAHPGDARTIYEVEYFDPASATSRLERIDFGLFQQEVQTKVRLYASLTDPAGTAQHRLETASEGQIFDFLSRNLAELQGIRRRLETLNNHIRTEVSRQEQGRLKGIRFELTVIKNHLVQANKKRHDYAARREELEQLKRLGIDSPADPAS